MRRKYVHTAETDAVIRAVYQDASMYRVKSVRVAVQRLGWPAGLIKSRAAFLGLCRTKELPWSNDELLLLDKWVHLHPRRIQLRMQAAGFRRTVGAIVQKRRDLDLLSCVDGYSAKQLGGLFGIDSHVIARWIEKGWLGGERRSDHHATGRDEWFIKHAAVYRFAVEHPNEYDLGKLNRAWFVDLLTQGKAVWKGDYRPITKRVQEQVKHLEQPQVIAKPKSIRPKAIPEAKPLRPQQTATRAPAAQGAAGLSPQEWQVLTMLLEGLRSSDVAERMAISPKTVASYKMQFMRKLGVRNDVALVKLAIQQGWTSLEGRAAHAAA